MCIGLLSDLAGVGARGLRHRQPQAAQLPRLVAAHHHAAPPAQVRCLAMPQHVARVCAQSNTLTLPYTLLCAGNS